MAAQRTMVNVEMGGKERAFMQHLFTIIDHNRVRTIHNLISHR